MQQFKLLIELPKEVLDRIESVIAETIRRELANHVREIQAKPLLLTRKEAAKKLRVSLPTLRAYENKGFLNGQRIGRRVLFSEDEIERFLAHK